MKQERAVENLLLQAGLSSSALSVGGGMVSCPGRICRVQLFSTADPDRFGEVPEAFEGAVTRGCGRM